jgi:hypothetical protein
VIDLEELKEDCKVEMFMLSSEGLQLIEIIEQQQEEIKRLKEELKAWHDDYMAI